MATERLEVRLDAEHQRKLRELAKEKGTAISETIRQLIDAGFEEVARQRRQRAAADLAKLQIEDVPDPAALTRQLERVHEPGGLS